MGKPLKSPEFYALANQVMSVFDPHMNHRGYVIASLDDCSLPSVSKISLDKEIPVWFVYSGMGSQWPEMARGMMQFEVFANSIKRSAEVLKPFGIDLYKLVLEDQPKRDESSIIPAFVSIASIQVALTDLLRSLGIKPAGIVGHSAGELGCAYADEGFTAEQTVLAAYWRGRSVEDNRDKIIYGAMAAVGLSWDEVEREAPHSVIAACDNSEDSVTISGPEEDVKRFVSHLKQNSVFAREVNVCRYAFHSQYIQAASPLLLESMKKLIPSPKPRTPRWVSSSFPEDQWDDPQAKFSSAEYFVHNMLSPVRFRTALEHIPDNVAVVEIGPHCLLQSILKRSLKPNVTILGLMKKNHPDNAKFFLENIGKLYSAGAMPRVENLYPAVQFPVPRNTELLSPYMAWDHSETWFYPIWEKNPLYRQKSEMNFEVSLEKPEWEHLSGHYIDGRVIFPATGYLLLAWQTLAKNLSLAFEELPVQIEDVEIHRASILPATGKVTYSVTITPSEGRFEIREGEVLLVTGKISRLEPEAPTPTKSSDTELILKKEDIYKELRLQGYMYRPSFQRLLEADLLGTHGLVQWDEKWEVFMDTMLHVTLLGLKNRHFNLPTRIRSVKINPRLHSSFAKDALVPVFYDRHSKQCIAGGVEITGLKGSNAPRRQVKEDDLVLEEYRFTPYVEHLKNEEALRYIERCAAMMKEAWKSNPDFFASMGAMTNPLNDLGEDKTESIINDLPANHVYLKFLKEISDRGTALYHMDFKEALAKFEKSFTNDVLFEALLNEASLRATLDVAIENIAKNKIGICEVCRQNSISKVLSNQLESFHCMKKFEYSVAHTASNFTSNNNPYVKSCFKWDLNGTRTELEKADIFIINNCLSEELFKRIIDIAKPATTILVIQRTIPSPFEALLSHAGIDLSFIGEKEMQAIFLKSHLRVLAKKTTEKVGCVTLLRKCLEGVKPENQVFVDIKDGDYESWLEPLKAALEKALSKPAGHNVWLYSTASNSGILGLVNCLRQESGGDRVRCVYDISSPASSLEGKHAPLDQIIQDDLVMNIFKEHHYGSYRFSSLGPIRKERMSPAYVNQRVSGDLSSFEWFESNLKFLPLEERVKIYFTSLNFRDIMLATGRIPPDSIPESVLNRKGLLGLEYVGRNAQNERVMGVVFSEGIATDARRQPEFQWFVPSKWSMAQAATVPIVYLTTYYALVVRGNLQPGDSILIHSATGGVGQAAIRLCLHYKCEIFVTVGTEEKRRFLNKHFPQIPNDHISNSRSTQFEKEVLELTEGEGVKYVLNSLADDKLQASLRCLQQDGHFLELGKFDLVKNTPLGMYIFLKNISVHGILLDSIFTQRNRAMKLHLGRLLQAGIDQGVVQPLPYTIFDVEKTEEAFRFMSSGKHIGKVLVQVREEEPELTATPIELNPLALPVPYCSPTKTYIITGGLGGFGLELATWLIEQGAKRLVLTSRRGPTQGYQHSMLRTWQLRGIQVTVSKRDAGKKDDCAQLLKEAGSLGSVGGIFNLAMVLKDALLENQTSEMFHQACWPKVQGTQNLDELSRTLCPELDWFVVFSSVSCGRGNAGQTNYGYANSVMERICEKRRREGLHGLAIQWGVVGDVGVVQEVMSGIDVAGTLPQPITSCLNTLGNFLTRTVPVVSSYLPQLSKLVSGPKKGGGEKDLKKILAHIMGIKEVSTIDPKKALSDLGLDSLMGVEIKQTLARDFDLDLPVQEIRKLTFEKISELEDAQNPVYPSEAGSTIKAEEPQQAVNLGYLVKPREQFIQFGSQREGPPIFFFPPLEGRSDIYRVLSQYFTRPIVGLQETSEMPLDSTGNIIKYFIKIIKNFQARGPYTFVGYSFGTFFALETACSLLREGDKIERVFLIDASHRFVSGYSSSYKARHNDALLKEADAEFFSMLALELPQVEKDKFKEELLRLPNYESRLNYISRLLYDKSDRKHSQEELQEACHAQYRKIFVYDVYEKHQKFPQNVVLVKASNSLEITKELPEDYGLSEVCSGKVSVYRIEATHKSILEGDAARQVVEIFYKTT